MKACFVLIGQSMRPATICTIGWWRVNSEWTEVNLDLMKILQDLKCNAGSFGRIARSFCNLSDLFNPGWLKVISSEV